jgi:CRISPR-associated protein Cas1
MTKNIFVRRAQWQAAGDSPKAIHLADTPHFKM